MEMSPETSSPDTSSSPQPFSPDTNVPPTVPMALWGFYFRELDVTVHVDEQREVSFPLLLNPQPLKNPIRVSLADIGLIER
jgi:hypothetical protein